MCVFCMVDEIEITEIPSMHPLNNSNHGFNMVAKDACCLITVSVIFALHAVCKMKLVAMSNMAAGLFLNFISFACLMLFLFFHV